MGSSVINCDPESLIMAQRWHASHMDMPRQSRSDKVEQCRKLRPNENVSLTPATHLAAWVVPWQGIEHNTELQGAVLLAQTHDGGWLPLQVLEN